MLEPEIVVQPGEIQRWRIVNASAHRYLDLAIEDPPGDAPNAKRTFLHPISQDGVNFGVSADHSEILMAPAAR